MNWPQTSGRRRMGGWTVSHCVKYSWLVKLIVSYDDRSIWQKICWNWIQLAFVDVPVFDYFTFPSVQVYYHLLIPLPLWSLYCLQFIISHFLVSSPSIFSLSPWRFWKAKVMLFCPLGLPRLISFEWESFQACLPGSCGQRQHPSGPSGLWPVSWQLYLSETPRLWSLAHLTLAQRSYVALKIDGLCYHFLLYLPPFLYTLPFFHWSSHFSSFVHFFIFWLSSFNLSYFSIMLQNLLFALLLK